MITEKIQLKIDRFPNLSNLTNDRTGQNRP